MSYIFYRMIFFYLQKFQNAKGSPGNLQKTES